MSKWNLFGTKEPEEKNPPEEKKTTGAGDNPELDDLKAEAAGYEPIGAGVGVETKGPSAAPSNPELLKVVWKLAFDTIAKRAGDHWKLSDDELTNLSAAAQPVVDKYVPAVLDKYGAEIVLAYTVAMIVVPRMGVRTDGKEA